MKKGMAIGILVIAFAMAIYSIQDDGYYNSPEFIADAKKLEKLQMFSRIPAEERTQATREALRETMERLDPPKPKVLKFLFVFGFTGIIGMAALWFCFSFVKFMKEH